MKMTILEIPHPLLREKSLLVGKEDVSQLLDDMLETMYEARGVGLAAPQVGVLKRVIVIDVGGKDARTPLFLINPRIVWHGEEKDQCSEGCLSVPNQFALVERFVSVRVAYEDRNRKSQKIEAEGLLSIALQHELDHLDGVLFLDYLSKLKQKMLIKRLEKSRKKKLSAEES